MNIVSFKVAKTLKEVGYPQYGSCEEYYNQEGRVIDKFCDINKLIYPAPTYLDVWLWLWQSKNIHIEIIDNKITTQCYATINDKKDTILFKSPEEAIIAAIEYLCDNDLIK